MILDTNFLIRLYQEKQGAFEKAMELQENNRTPRVPAPVVQELEYGAAYLDSDETRRKVRNITKMYPVAELTVFDHRRAGQLHAQADRRSTGDTSGVDDVDAMVAAVAQRFDEPVLTENTGDFEQLGVEIETF